MINFCHYKSAASLFLHIFAAYLIVYPEQSTLRLVAAMTFALLSALPLDSCCGSFYTCKPMWFNLTQGFYQRPSCRLFHYLWTIGLIGISSPSRDCIFFFCSLLAPARQESINIKEGGIPLPSPLYSASLTLFIQCNL